MAHIYLQKLLSCLFCKLFYTFTPDYNDDREFFKCNHKIKWGEL